MAEFEKKLDAELSDAEKKRQVADDLYKKYVQYVGELDALPQNLIDINRLGSDIHDQFGRVRPFSQWPTKTSRERSEKVWLNYNQRLQLQQAAQEAGLEGDTPTENPDFLGQMLDTCVRTSMKTGGLDKRTAFKHCSKQVERFERAIRGAIADKGLPAKEAEALTKEMLKGMGSGKQIDMKDLSIEDRQFIQDLQDSLTYKKQERIKEDIDDKDTFIKPCSYYDCENRPDSEKFHQAHTAAFENAKRQPTSGKFSDVIQREMAKFGYNLIHTGKPVRFGTPFDDKDWTIKEDVDTTQTLTIGNLQLKVGDWIEIGPSSKVSAGEGLDDQDTFSNEDTPPTPVQIASIQPVARGSEFRIRLNNFNLLNQPDKSGVTWHNRPRRNEPSWYEPWHNMGWYDDVLWEFYENGELRKIDNIEQWFQSQPTE